LLNTLAKGSQTTSALRIQMSWTAVDKAQGAGNTSVRQAQRKTSIEPDAGCPGDHGIVSKPVIDQSIGHNHRCRRGKQVRTKGGLREVSRSSLKPQDDLIHCRSRSTRVTRAIGTSKRAAARRVRASNRSSGPGDSSGWRWVQPSKRGQASCV
jgi:hypothetical protein